MFHVEHSLRVGIIKGCPVILLVKSEFVGMYKGQMTMYN